MIDDVELGWEDVLRRARRRRFSARLVALAVVAVAALGAAPALAVLLTRPSQPHLPKAADRSRIAIAVDPRTRRVVVEAAPWKGHDGVCYLIVRYSSGCATWSKHGAELNGGWASGYTFDARVSSVTARLRSGRTIQLTVHRFPRLRITFFAGPRIAGMVTSYTFRDDAGRVVLRQSLLPPKRR